MIKFEVIVLISLLLWSNLSQSQIKTSSNKHVKVLAKVVSCLYIPGTKNIVSQTKFYGCSKKYIESKNETLAARILTVLSMTTDVGHVRKCNLTETKFSKKINKIGMYQCIDLKDEGGLAHIGFLQFNQKSKITDFRAY